MRWCALLKRFLGSLLFTGACLVVGFALMYAVKATGTLRVSEEIEREGLDLREHGGGAYHFEFGLSSLTLPSTSGRGNRVPASVGSERTHNSLSNVP